MFTPSHPHSDDHPVPIGMVDQASAKIYLRDDVQEQVVEETIFHELLHTVAMYENLTENQISRISSDIYAVLRNNDLLRDGWKDSIIDEFDESVGDLNDIDPVQPVDRAEKEGLAR